ncbi:MAG: glycerate dehydrogenase [Rariglobus sp.]|jgi:phosphoglycerate dehydrogenase-like enzyme|nr:glycerate dehydrogenase [Rariglobus sp.]
MKRLKGLYLLETQSLPLIYGSPEQRDIARHVDFVAPPQTRESIRLDPSPLHEAEVIFSGWGAPMMDLPFLLEAPCLRAVFYGAGTTGYFTSDAFWERNITLTSSYAANAVPVAEYTLGVILLSLRSFWSYSVHAKAGGAWGDQTRFMPGAYQTTVALVGCGMIARRLIELLKPFDLNCIVYDPYLDDYEAAKLGVTRCSLEEAFIHGDVVSLHAANKVETKGLVTGELFALMKKSATFINTARGPIIRELELTDVLRTRPDLTAVIDVCDIEPPLPGNPLLTTPNVILTPHIAGSHAAEVRRLGRYMVEELERYVKNEPLRWQITRERSARLA